MRPSEQKKQAKEFSRRWENRGYEKGESESFWIDLLHNVMGIENPTQYIEYERRVDLDNKSFIDAYIEQTHTLIEQKSIDKDLNKPIKQSDGTVLTPFEQAQRYSINLSYSERPRWIVVCNFQEFHIYDMEEMTGRPTIVKLEDLSKDYYQLEFLIKRDNTHIEHETDISFKAGRLVGDIYQALLKEYNNPEDEHSKKSINQLVVRIVFCLYAEDTDIFGRRNMFHDYMEEIEPRFWRLSLQDLFHILDTKIEDRDKYTDPKLNEFPYVNGGMFADENIEIPNFTQEIKDIILTKASYGFNWSEISPTIFGAVFESTLNPEVRRSGGMHYTSIENIHKVIDPLFLDDLTNELNEIKQYKQPKILKDKARAYQRKLSQLKFLDPACGSGNFLTETYLSLRKLENEAIKLLQGEQPLLDVDESIIKVNIHQFYGIEVNDFAVSVAKTALWIAESQMMEETKSLLYANFDFLPLKSYSNIIEGNALQMDWNKVVPNYELNYIMGNPPFIGARLMNKYQKNDLRNVFLDVKNVGNLDYVSAWYKISSRFMKNTTIQGAFVSTNSITQGQQVKILWENLLKGNNLKINFAYRTFKWSNETKKQAGVYCVIIGFGYQERKEKWIFDNDQTIKVKNINAYLIDANNIFIENRSKPLCQVPKIGIGNKPIDGGNYLFSKKEMDIFTSLEPKSKKYFKQWYGGRELLNGAPRYCLWLGECSPRELHSMSHCLERVKNVKDFRLRSKSPTTNKIANKPTRFHIENMPKTKYIALPRISSSNRSYIPAVIMSHEILCSDDCLIMQSDNLYDIGIIESKAHMSWVRAVCGRLGNGYRYSAKVVYNNFPWIEETKEQKEKISKTAQAILDARKLYPESSLADLYDDLTMPIELRKAHEANDKAVLAAYGLDNDASESEIVTELFKRYEKLTSK